MVRLLWRSIGVTLVLGVCLGYVREKPVLCIYTWADYIDPELIAAFEKAQDCKVKIDTFDTYVLGAMPISSALDALDPALKSKVVISSETMKRGEAIRGFDDRPEISGLYEKAWERV